MSRRRRSTLACAVCLGAALAGIGVVRGVGAATLDGQSELPLRQVRLDAIAVDGRGNIVKTLAPADFEVREGETPYPLDEARFVQDESRAIAIYLDEYHLTAGPNADRVRAALREMLERDITPGDVLIVMKPLDSIFAIQPVASRSDALAIVDSVQGRKGDLQPRTDYERNQMAGSPERIEALRAQVAVSAINALAVRLASMNDRRKTLFVVTEGLDQQRAARRGQEYLATLDSIIRSANRGNVSIYPIDPRVPDDRSADGQAAGSSSLRALADSTEGRLVVASGTAADGGLASAVRSAIADASAYYMLVYRNALDENGRFHPVDVRVNKPGVVLRARRGYWAPSPSDRLGAELLAAAKRPPAPVRVQLERHNSPLIRPWFGLSLTDAGQMRVTFVWEPSSGVPGRARDLTAARVDLTVLDDKDTVLFQGPVRPTGPVVAAGAEPSRAVFETEPGKLELRMKIEDAARRQIDSDVRDLEIRDVRGKVTIGTPEFLRARNALELRALHDNPDAVPVSSREFSRTERLLIRVPAYAPGGRPSLTARLLNFAGQPMRTLETREGPGGVNEVEIILAGLASGQYMLELVAASDAGQIIERVGFRVTT